MADPSPAPVSEGEILAKKYRVEKVLGVGGMGVVVAAMHLQLDQRVALKFLLPSVLYNRDVVARFAREARAAAQIRSEHVARVIDVGELETGSPYMVMEFLEGEDLEHVVERRGALPFAEVVSFVLQACDALAEAHVLGIVHRDLKPANLFLARRPDKTSLVKVLDFGISKSVGTPDAAMTSTQAIMGSPYYMSPEQLVSSKTVDARSDVWALGVILYELLTATRPFEAESMPGLVATIIQSDPPPLDERRADLPAALRGAVMRCLEKERGNRFASVAGLANALAPFAPEESRHLVKRIARVLGEPQSTPTPVSTPALATAATAILSRDSVTATPAPATPAEPGPVSNAAQSVSVAGITPAAAKSAASWGATHSESPAPPINAFPLRAVLGIGAVVAVLGVAGAVVKLSKPHDAAGPIASAALVAEAEAPTNTAPPAPATTASVVTVALVDASVADSAAASSGADAGNAPTVILRQGAGAGPSMTSTPAVAGRVGRPPNRPAEAPILTPPPPAPATLTVQPAAEPTNKMKMDMK